jgi:4-hydroxybenzoate polyprenyltransferase
MTKIINALLYIVFLVDYAYAAWMTSVKPDETYWGFICVFLFGYIFTWTVSIVVNHSKKSDNKEE